VATLRDIIIKSEKYIFKFFPANWHFFLLISIFFQLIGDFPCRLTLFSMNRQLFPGKRHFLQSTIKRHLNSQFEIFVKIVQIGGQTVTTLRDIIIKSEKYIFNWTISNLFPHFGKWKTNLDGEENAFLHHGWSFPKCELLLTNL